MREIARRFDFKKKVKDRKYYRRKYFSFIQKYPKGKTEKENEQSFCKGHKRKEENEIKKEQRWKRKSIDKNKSDDKRISGQIRRTGV